MIERVSHDYSIDHRIELFDIYASEVLDAYRGQLGFGNINRLVTEVKQLLKEVKDLEYEVEHWQGELRSRMHPIDYDALVNGGEEE